MTEADILNRLNLGVTKQVLEGNPNSPLAELLQTLIQDVIDQITAKADDYDINASYNLRQSILPSKSAYIQDGALKVHITAPFYWKFVNYGVNGTEVNHGAPAWGRQPAQDKSFRQAIGEWIQNRGITLPNQFDEYDSFAWAMMNSIKKKGKAARPFFTDVVNAKLYEQIQEPISNVIGESIRIQIVEPWQ